MLVTTWQKRVSLPENERKMKVNMNGKYLENVESEKLLGVVVIITYHGKAISMELSVTLVENCHS